MEGKCLQNERTERERDFLEYIVTKEEKKELTYNTADRSCNESSPSCRRRAKSNRYIAVSTTNFWIKQSIYLRMYAPVKLYFDAATTN